MREIKVYAPAKLNLYLDVLDKRQDGYHNIETVFEKIDLLDEIVIKEKGRGFEVRTNSSMCPEGRDNIVYKALEILSRELDLSLNLDIEIKKRIPVAAGLGGGSSDAASVLRAVNKIFELGLSKEEFLSFASRVGKDVAFFMLDAPFSIGRGSGELLEEVAVEHSFFHILVKPQIPISTAEMYKRIDKTGHLQKRGGLEKVIDAIKNADVSLLKENYYNVFEHVLNGYNPSIEDTKALLFNAGVKECFLSGSGPTVFCIFNTREEAREFFSNIPKDKLREVFLASTYKKGDIYGDN